ncbi:amidohydrolase family protein [Desulfoscipio gibsoniae]|uniref:Amidohydrolase, imidazolonepropionase n=1 Tax=Desulfoscipio gibsoniae DSM 7213 TaxID=767817 RepID=R4KDW8_9FIRM|nr:amidohydrolase family protein [Desulfoscipio gibsoniae]AGK99871.1 amidohydrolase, imidazolonepropionase [Desulfoscipio gibsoniae DSM 7213]
MELIKITSTQNYVIKIGNIIEGGSESPVKKYADRYIYLENGRIASITGAGDASYQFTQPTRPTISLDLGGLTVLPPLVDCHVHMALDGLDFSAARQRWDQPDELYTQVGAQLWDTLCHGILAVRDGGDLSGIGLRYRELVANDSLPGPIIRASGYALRKPQKYGSFLGRGIPTEMLDSTLDDLTRLKVDQIKVLVSGVVSFQEYARVGPLQYTADELKALVEGAHSRGLGVMAHASSDEAVAMAVQAGVDTIEHGYFLSRATLELMAKNKVAWIPTVIPVAAQEARGRFSRFLAGKQENRPLASPPASNVIAQTVERQLSMISEAHALGVTLGVGTDAGASGVRHGYSYWQELNLYRQAGLTPDEIIRCATINSAHILGLDWGGIAPERPAAMIAVSGNPLADIGNLQNIAYVFQPE